MARLFDIFHIDLSDLDKINIAFARVEREGDGVVLVFGETDHPGKHAQWRLRFSPQESDRLRRELSEED